MRRRGTAPRARARPRRPTPRSPQRWPDLDVQRWAAVVRLPRAGRRPRDRTELRAAASRRSRRRWITFFCDDGVSHAVSRLVKIAKQPTGRGRLCSSLTPRFSWLPSAAPRRHRATSPCLDDHASLASFHNVGVAHGQRCSARALGDLAAAYEVEDGERGVGERLHSAATVEVGPHARHIINGRLRRRFPRSTSPDSCAPFASGPTRPPCRRRRPRTRSCRSAPTASTTSAVVVERGATHHLPGELHQRRASARSSSGKSRRPSGTVDEPCRHPAPR